MRNTIKNIALFFSVALMASCAQEPLESPLYSGEITISAFQGDRQNETKTALVDGEVYWSANEHISIFYGSGENGGSEFISTNTEPAPQVEFSGYINAVTGTVEGNQPLMFWGIYPYNALNSCDGNGVTTVIPDHQTAKPDTFADNQFVSVGRAPGLAMGFYNLLSGLKITFSKRTDITELRIRSLNSQDKLAGEVHVVLDEENHPVVDNVIDGKGEIVLTCPEGETFQKGHYYYALFRPQTLSQGIVIDFYAGNVYIGSREYARSLNFYRNLFKRGDDIDSDIVLAVTGVELNKTALSLSVGAEETLQATVTPADAADKTVTWSSSDETVATVSSNGKVTAVKAGQAEITAAAGGKSATCTVTVSNVAVTSVSLNKTTLTLTKGGSETLTAMVLPSNATDKTVTWTTSNSAVASVDASGKVTAVAGGSATITAAAGSKTATCEVTVTVPVRRLLIGWDNNNDNLVVDYDSNGNPILRINSGKPLDLTLSASPSNHTETITWSMSNASSVALSNMSKTGCRVLGTVSGGAVTVYATASGGESASIDIVIYKTGKPIPVDLGLPSGTKWGSMNIEGASLPESPGYYYAWGAISTSSSYNFENYRYCEGSGTSLTKYCNNSEYGYEGFTDNLSTLELEDDLAYKKLGGTWRIPTREQWQELLNASNLTWIWGQRGSGSTARYGWSVSSSTTGGRIFLPVAGYYKDSSRSSDLNIQGYYWSSTLVNDAPDKAYYMFFSKTTKSITRNDRALGMSIRPVCQ